MAVLHDSDARLATSLPHRTGPEREDDQRLCWSSAWWSPPPESNRRPHPDRKMTSGADQPASRIRSGGCWLQGDLVAHALKLPYQPVPVGLMGLALDEVVGAQVGVGLAAGEQMPGDDQDRVGNSQGRLLGIPTTPQPGVLGGQIAVLGPRGRMRRLDQRDPQPLGSLASPTRAMLAGRLIVAWTHPGPGGQVGGGRE